EAITAALAARSARSFLPERPPFIGRGGNPWQDDHNGYARSRAAKWRAESGLPRRRRDDERECQLWDRGWSAGRDRRRGVRECVLREAAEDEAISADDGRRHGE